MREKYDQQLRRDDYIWRTKVRILSHVDPWLKDHLEGLTIMHKRDGTSLLIGDLIDMPTLYGFLLQLRDANLVIISLEVKRVPL